jgi:bifunctional enzyme CysN/CysC
MPVQWVNRPNLDFRGFAGLIAEGTVKPGRCGAVIPSGKTSTVKSIVTFDGDLPEAAAGQSVTLTLADEIDCSRGDVLAAADDPPQSADQFEATVVWMSDDTLIPGRGYWLKLATQTVSATVAQPKYEVNVNTMEHLAAKTLELNSIGVCEVTTDKPIVFEPYADSRQLGGFVLIDKLTNATVAAGMIHFCLRRAQNVHWQALEVGREAHAASRARSPRCCGSPACRARASRPSPTWSRRSSTPPGATPSCSTATTSATGSTRTSASPRPTGSRTSAASARSPS